MWVVNAEMHKKHTLVWNFIHMCCMTTHHTLCNHPSIHPSIRYICTHEQRSGAGVHYHVPCVAQVECEGAVVQCWVGVMAPVAGAALIELHAGA